MEVADSLRAASKAGLPDLAEIFGHILESRGKLIRPAITLLAGKLYNYNSQLHVPMAAAVELLHTATLVHDDTIDNALTRRGNATINSLWGKGTAVLVGDHLFANSAELVASTGNLRVIRLFARTLMTICNGELGQSFSAYNWRMSREKYYSRIASKTACLFSTAAQSGAILSQAPEPAIQALRSYGDNFGIAFQIVDDILDFIGDEKEMGKPVGGDLWQGTVTLPAILLLERYPEDSPVRKMFENKRKRDNFKRALEMIRNSDIIRDSFDIASQFSAVARQALEDLPASSCRQALADLADYVVERSY